MLATILGDQWEASPPTLKALGPSVGLHGHLYALSFATGYDFFRRHYSRVFPKEKITTAQNSSWAYVLLEVVMVIFTK